MTTTSRLGLLLTVSLCTSGCVTLVSAWDYLHHGNDWDGACQGDNESPIDIQPDRTSFDPSLRGLVFTNYDSTDGFHFDLFNNGHTLEVELEAGVTEAWVSAPHLAGSRYKLEQFHFHWGNTSATGSEHTFSGGRHAPLELHLVHRNLKYLSLGAAVNYTDGLLVLSVMFDVVEEGSGEEEDISPWIASIVSHIPDVIAADPAHRIRMSPALRLSQLLPADRESFYRYHGSLTTPPCTESVSWTVFHRRLNVLETQLQQFRRLMDADNMPLNDNHRDTKPLNNRVVYSSFLSASSAATSVSRLVYHHVGVTVLGILTVSYCRQQI